MSKKSWRIYMFIIAFVIGWILIQSTIGCVSRSFYDQAEDKCISRGSRILFYVGYLKHFACEDGYEYFGKD